MQVLELLKKLILTGFLLLVPPDLIFLRLVIALLICMAYLVLLMHARPHREPTTAAVAVSVNVVLVCLFFTALLIKIANEVMPHTRLNLFGSESVFSLTVLLIVYNFSVLVCTLAVLVQQMRSEAQHYFAQQLRYANGEAVEIGSIPHDAYHLFLSHAW